MNGGKPASPFDDPLGPVVESFLERFRRGERPALTALMERHPELAGQIRDLIPALVELEQLGGSAGSVILSSGQRTGTRESGSESPSPERLGDYLLIRRIGGGGMGVVYEAEHESLKNRVALKVMQPRFRADPKYLRRFHAEARLAAGLHHTNIVSVFDYGEHDGVCYYAMQFIQGQPLDRVLADIRRLRGDAVDADHLMGPDANVTIPDTAASPAASAAVKGLLTGRFDGATDAVSIATATGQAARDAVALVAGNAESARDANCRSGETLQHPGSRTAEEGPEESVDHEPVKFGSSSLSNLRELRYYREIARVGVQVADALEYAHRRGVLHRDVKPSNLLLDAMGNVWMTDFGLAKLEESADLTQSRELVGTLRYMAPERFRGTSDRYGDIYSLGATLYELLALRPPFQETDQIRLIERIRNDAPPPPRQLDRNVPRDLETIVLKALSKESADRFRSAGAMADELRRFVEGRPIRSRPVSDIERLWRWCKRDPRLAAVSIAAALLTIVLAVVSTTAAIFFRKHAGELEIERLRSDRAALDARWRAVDAYAAQARAGGFSRRPGQRFESLEAVRQAVSLLNGLPRGPDSDPRRERLRDLAIAALALPDLKRTGRVVTQPPEVIASAFDPTMTRYAFRFRDGAISIRRIVDDGEVARFQVPGDQEIWVFSFSPDGRYLATTHQPGRALTVWDVDRGATAVEDPGPVWRAARFSPDSRRIAVAHEDGDFLVYDLATGQPGRPWPARADRLAFRPDGAQIAAIDNASKPATCRILEGESGTLVRLFPLRTGADDVAWSPDGVTLATAGYDPKIDLWDAATGIPRATLEGHDNSGLSAAFHPAGTLLASNGWEGRLRLWDPVLGRPWLSLTGSYGTQFSRDGRIVVTLEDKLTMYQVDPALEYRTFAHASREPMDYANPSIRHDGRVLAVGSNRGAVLWDLARGIELAFLPIGNAWNLMFEPSGDLITSGSIGVQRWPVQLDRDRGQFHIGPPRQVPLPVSHGGIAEDRSSRIVALADRDYAYVAIPERMIPVGPLDDCRSVAVSPDGQWLATGSQITPRAQVWRIADGTKVAELPTGAGGIRFSPDGKWLAGNSRLRLWQVGTWREHRQITEVGGYFRCFSPDGRLMVVADPDQVIRLVESETGRTLARLASPDLCTVGNVAFSADGSRLVVATKDRPSPAVHVWDLRKIRKHLVRMGLNWDAPPYSEDDPANASAPPLPPSQVDFGTLAGHLDEFTEPPAERLERYTARLKSDPNDADAYHHRARALADLERLPEAIDDLTQAIRLRPNYARSRSLRAVLYQFLKRYEPAIADLETVLARQADQPAIRERLALCCNNRAWELATGPQSTRDPHRALHLARRAVDLTPAQNNYLNSLGVVQYRAGEYAEAITTLERSLAAGNGQTDAFDLFFLAMAHHRLGHREGARALYERAVRWISQKKNLSALYSKELVTFRAEAEAVLAGPASELPADVFAPAR